MLPQIFHTPEELIASIAIDQQNVTEAVTRNNAQSLRTTRAVVIISYTDHSGNAQVSNIPYAQTVNPISPTNQVSTPNVDHWIEYFQNEINNYSSNASTPKFKSFLDRLNQLKAKNIDISPINTSADTFLDKSKIESAIQIAENSANPTPTQPNLWTRFTTWLKTIKISENGQINLPIWLTVKPNPLLTVINSLKNQISQPKTDLSAYQVGSALHAYKPESNIELAITETPDPLNILETIKTSSSIEEAIAQLKTILRKNGVEIVENPLDEQYRLLVNRNSFDKDINDPDSSLGNYYGDGIMRITDDNKNEFGFIPNNTTVKQYIFLHPDFSSLPLAIQLKTLTHEAGHFIEENILDGTAETIDETPGIIRPVSEYISTLYGANAALTSIKLGTALAQSGLAGQIELSNRILGNPDNYLSLNNTPTTTSNQPNLWTRFTSWLNQKWDDLTGKVQQNPTIQPATILPQQFIELGISLTQHSDGYWYLHIPSTALSHLTLDTTIDTSDPQTEYIYILGFDGEEIVIDNLSFTVNLDSERTPNIIATDTGTTTLTSEEAQFLADNIDNADNLHPTSLAAKLVSLMPYLAPTAPATYWSLLGKIASPKETAQNIGYQIFDGDYIIRTSLIDFLNNPQNQSILEQATKFIYNNLFNANAQRQTELEAFVLRLHQYNLAPDPLKYPEIELKGKMSTYLEKMLGTEYYRQARIASLNRTLPPPFNGILPDSPNSDPIKLSAFNSFTAKINTINRFVRNQDPTAITIIRRLLQEIDPSVDEQIAQVIYDLSQGKTSPFIESYLRLGKSGDNLFLPGFDELSLPYTWAIFGELALENALSRQLIPPVTFSVHAQEMRNFWQNNQINDYFILTPDDIFYKLYDPQHLSIGAHAGGFISLISQTAQSNDLVTLLHHEAIHQFILPTTNNPYAEISTELLAQIIHLGGRLPPRNFLSSLYQPGVNQLIDIIEQINQASDNDIGLALFIRGVIEYKAEKIPHPLYHLRDYYESVVTTSPHVFPTLLEKYTDNVFYKEIYNVQTQTSTTPPANSPTLTFPADLSSETLVRETTAQDAPTPTSKLVEAGKTAADPILTFVETRTPWRQLIDWLLGRTLGIVANPQGLQLFGSAEISVSLFNFANTISVTLPDQTTTPPTTYLVSNNSLISGLTGRGVSLFNLVQQLPDNTIITTNTKATFIVIDHDLLPYIPEIKVVETTPFVVQIASFPLADITLQYRKDPSGYYGSDHTLINPKSYDLLELNHESGYGFPQLNESKAGQLSTGEVTLIMGNFQEPTQPIDRQLINRANLILGQLGMEGHSLTSSSGNSAEVAGNLVNIMTYGLWSQLHDGQYLPWPWTGDFGEANTNVENAAKYFGGFAAIYDPRIPKPLAIIPELETTSAPPNHLIFIVPDKITKEAILRGLVINPYIDQTKLTEWDIPNRIFTLQDILEGKLEQVIYHNP